MDEKPDEDIARVEGCKHVYCRDCLRQYILAQMNERRFPVICPTCAPDKKKRNPGGGCEIFPREHALSIVLVVNQFLIQTIGIPEKAYAIFEELQLLAFSLPVNCRK